MAQSPRARKIADQIQQVVATLLERRIKDPRLGFVTITDVRVTGDLQHATIFYTVYGSEQERKDSAAALQSAKGMIRSEVGKALKIRLTPSLEFIADALPETAASIEDALTAARHRDAELAKQAAGADYAAGPDAYRTRQEAQEAEDDEIDGFEGFDRADELGD